MDETRQEHHFFLNSKHIFPKEYKKINQKKSKNTFPFLVVDFHFLVVDFPFLVVDFAPLAVDFPFGWLTLHLTWLTLHLSVVDFARRWWLS